MAKKRVIKTDSKRYNSKYKPEYVDDLKQLLLAGYSITDICKYFDVSRVNFYQWLKTYPEFAAARRVAEYQALSKLSDVAYQRALGWSCVQEKVMLVNGEPQIVQYRENYPPDAKLLQFVLERRLPEVWGARKDDSKGDVVVEINTGVPKGIEGTTTVHVKQLEHQVDEEEEDESAEFDPDDYEEVIDLGEDDYERET